MTSILGDGTGPGGPGSSRCLLLLQRSLAIQLTRGPPPHVPPNAGQRESPKEHPADEMWMYDKGYNLFQVSRRRVACYLRSRRSSFTRRRCSFIWRDCGLGSLRRQTTPQQGRPRRRRRAGFLARMAIGAGEVCRGSARRRRSARRDAHVRIAASAASRVVVRLVRVVRLPSHAGPLR